MNTALATLNIKTDLWHDESQLAEVKRLVSEYPLSDAEFAALVQLGRATQLNPFNRELWAIKYSKTAAASIYIGRDGYRKAAQRQPEYEYHQVNAIYSEDTFEVVNDTINHSYGINRGTLLGAYCKVKRKSSSRYSYVIVTLAEYGSTQSVWKTKPETMIKKVAEAQALRQAFQEVFSGTYSEAEIPDESPKHTVLSGKTQTDNLKQLFGIGEQDVQELDYSIIDADTGEYTPHQCNHVLPEQSNSSSQSANETHTKENADHNDMRISAQQLRRINELFKEKQLSKERKNKAFFCYQVLNESQLTFNDAEKLIKQLERIK